MGRSTPPGATLDQLFALPGAAITLEAATGLRPTGLGAVAYREAEGAAAAGVRRDVEALLGASGGPAVERSVDAYGYTWLLVRMAATPDVEGGADASGGGAGSVDVSALVTDLHAVNSGLVDAGFGSSLLCTLVGFTDADGRRLGLVYLFKRGTFYPFAPTGRDTRDSAFELQVRAAVGVDLPVEADVTRWFPVWGAPGV